jgi:putative cell wall-binding protein
MKGDFKQSSVSTSRSSTGGGYTPPVIPTPGTVSISNTDTEALIKQLGYVNNQFYVAPVELEGSLAALDIFTTTPDLADLIHEITLRDVLILEENPYDTISAFVLEKFPNGAPRVIIARGDMGPDSCASVAYAKSLKIPILLVEPDEIPEIIQSTLNQLETEEVIIVGGYEAVSTDVEENLPDGARIGGEDRYETAVEMAEVLMAMKNVDTLVLTDGTNIDPRSVMIASYYRAPIVYTKGDEVPTSTLDFLNKHEFKRVIMVGVSKVAETRIRSVV